MAVKVLTGDNDLVSRKVCHEVGLPTEQIVLGTQVETMSDDELAAAAEATTLFARLSPAHKQQIVQALQRKGHVVGFLGDGINDAPGLRAADVGVSVDTAVDIAKESADVILLEKSLMVLEEGVLEGRKVFANILKYIRMGASSNFGNMFSVIGASAFLKFLPMLPVQVLTNNLLYDFSQVPIPTDEVDPEQIAKPRPWLIDEITRFILFIGPISSIFDYTTFFVMLYVFGCWDNEKLVPERLVRRVADHADADHPHHPHQPHPVLPEPGELAADGHDGDHHGRRDGAALYSVGQQDRPDGASAALLADPGGDDVVLLPADATGEEVAAAEGVDLNRTPLSRRERGRG